MKLEKPGVYDMQWMLAVQRSAGGGVRYEVSFYEEEHQARAAAAAAMREPRTAVFVAQVVGQAEAQWRKHARGTAAPPAHRPARPDSEGPLPFEATDDRPTRPMRALREA